MFVPTMAHNQPWYRQRQLMYLNGRGRWAIQTDGKRRTQHLPVVLGRANWGTLTTSTSFLFYSSSYETLLILIPSNPSPFFAYLQSPVSSPLPSRRWKPSGDQWQSTGDERVVLLPRWPNLQLLTSLSALLSRRWRWWRATITRADKSDHLLLQPMHRRQALQPTATTATVTLILSLALPGATVGQRVEEETTKSHWV